MNDLTVVADTVAEKDFDRRRQEALERGFTPETLPTWDELEPLSKRNFKAQLLPIIIDVLDALEKDEVKPPEAKTMVEYDYLNNDRSDPRWYENQHPIQHEVRTATVWTLHLNIHPKCKDAVLSRMALLPEPTGEYTYGDSWFEWGEKAKSDTDRHLAIYFRADPEKAQAVGYHLANHATFAAMQVLGGDNAKIPPYAVSTAGDYAEQIPNL